MTMYSICPICQNLHDDGVVYLINDTYYFVCFDCDESCVNIIKKLEIIDNNN